MALSNLSSVVRSNYKNTVGDYEITYNVIQDEGKPAATVSASIKKGENRFGYVGIEADGRRNITLEPGIEDATAKTIIETVIDDAAQIFNERNQIKEA